MKSIQGPPTLPPMTPAARELLSHLAPTQAMPAEVQAELALRLRGIQQARPTVGPAHKAFALGLTAVGTFGLWLLLRSAPAEVSLPPPVVHQSPASSRQVQYRAALPAPPAPSVAPNLSERSPRPPRALGSAPRHAPVDPVDGPGLAEELRLMDLARRHLRIGDLDAAQDLLVAHALRFPQGQLSDLRDYLEIQVDTQRGAHQAASAKVQRFLQTHPRSTFQAEVRQLMVPHAPAKP